VEAEALLDQPLLLERGLEQVEPHGIFRKRRLRIAFDALEARRHQAVDGKHRRPPVRAAAGAPGARRRCSSASRQRFSAATRSSMSCISCAAPPAISTSVTYLPFTMNVGVLSTR